MAEDPGFMDLGDESLLLLLPILVFASCTKVDDKGPPAESRGRAPLRVGGNVPEAKFKLIDL